VGPSSPSFATARLSLCISCITLFRPPPLRFRPFGRRAGSRNESVVQLPSEASSLLSHAQDRSDSQQAAGQLGGIVIGVGMGMGMGGGLGLGKPALDSASSRV
jgi:hypothetical protein